MSCFLFDKIIFGPVISRRLGISLGINLLPHNKKVCTFDCVYCECGWTKTGHYQLENPYKREDVREALENTLKKIHTEKSGLDNITFGGNGEPTLHPDFSDIVDDVIKLRNTYFPNVKISVLSNATGLDKPSVLSALKKIDNPILKLDAGTEESLRIINNPMTDISLQKIVNNLIEAKIEHAIVQTMFLKGKINGVDFDNTKDVEVQKWITYVKQINPKSVMIYSIARETPARNLTKVTPEELAVIVSKLKEVGVFAEAF